MLAGALERRCFLKRGHFNLYPNLYVFIVGKSGIIRKSTSTGLAVNLLKQLEDIKMLSDRVTAGSLIEQMALSKKLIEQKSGEDTPQASLYIYSSELIVLMREVFGQIVELLTRFWDCPETWDYKTKHHGNILLEGVCVNMLAATTIQWLREGVSQQVMSAGFAGRIIFVCVKERSKPVAWPKTNPQFDIYRQELVQDLNSIYHLQGEFKPTAEAEAFYQQWYDWYMPNVADLNEDSRMDGYYGRQGDMVLKVAMIRSVSLGSSMIIEKSHLEWAIAMLKELEPDLEDIYSKPKDHPDNTLKFMILDFVNKKFRKAPFYATDAELRRFLSDKKAGITAYRIDKAMDELLLEDRIVPMRSGGEKPHYTFNDKINQVFD